ncbi:MAG: hypothetical protein ACRDS0_38280 [Pseudonocardiaceae bacterium]
MLEGSCWAQTDQPGDEPLGGAEDLIEVLGEELRIIRLLIGEELTDLGQDDRQPLHDRGDQFAQS